MSKGHHILKNKLLGIRYEHCSGRGKSITVRNSVQLGFGLGSEILFVSFDGSFVRSCLRANGE